MRKVLHALFMGGLIFLHWRKASFAMTWFLLFATLILASCSTMTKEQCEKVDWKDIGLIDGQKGRVSAKEIFWAF